MVPFLFFIIRVNVYMFVVIMFLVNSSSFLSIADASKVLFVVINLRREFKSLILLNAFSNKI